MSIQPALQKDINPLIKNVKIAVASHELKTGAYSRWIQPDPSGKTNRELGINEYGCADAANLLYTIGHFPQAPQERAQWIETLQFLQNPKTGLFTEATHHPIHTTAHCIAALELFDAVPIHPLSDLAPYKTKEGLYGLLEGLRWKDSPWDNSHQGAGIFAAMNLSGEATPQWNRWYFDWFWQEADPETGLWRKGCVTAGPARRFEHMAGSFHYLFNHEYARMPLRYPEKMIDTCLDMYEKNDLRVNFEGSVNFIQVDWVYCITRALRQCGHRFDECRAALIKFADPYIDFLLSLDPHTSDEFNDLHMLFGALCCVSELQQALPGCIHSDKPLKLVLDRRPFI